MRLIKLIEYKFIITRMGNCAKDPDSNSKQKSTLLTPTKDYKSLAATGHNTSFNRN